MVTRTELRARRNGYGDGARNCARAATVLVTARGTARAPQRFW